MVVSDAKFENGGARSHREGCSLRAWWCVVLLAGAFLAHAPAQDAQDPAGASSVESPLGTAVTVHGLVKNALTGEPLPRVLLQVNGQSGLAVLTDGDGRFEIPGVPLGPGVFQLTKPGFEDAIGSPAGVEMRDLRGYTRNVFVTANAPELEFAMRPTNSIHGQIELATGDPAQNNNIALLQRQIQNGRAVWRISGGARVNAEGAYHFAHLEDGDYVVVAEPAPDSDREGQELQADTVRDVAINWFPQVFYPDARDFSGAAKIHLAGGEQAEANITMPLEAAHPVRASVLLPATLGTSPEGVMVQSEVLDTEGRHVPYPSTYDGKSKTLRALLPDGSYVLRVSASKTDRPPGSGLGRLAAAVMTGQVEVTVAGHAVTKLRIPVGPQTPTPLQVMVTRSSTEATAGTSVANANAGEVAVEIAQAGQPSDGMSSMFAQGAVPGTLDTVPPSPGKYWVHTVVAIAGLCEDSFAAGGANLGREPLTVNQGGGTAPLTLTLRDDCAGLKVSLPASVAGMTAGEEPEYTVYVVPDFDSTTGAQWRTFRPSTMTSFTFMPLTPGSYHVYTFAAPVELEYHNREALAALRGRQITLMPGETGSLELEVPAQ